MDSPIHDGIVHRCVSQYVYPYIQILSVHITYILGLYISVQYIGVSLMSIYDVSVGDIL